MSADAGSTAADRAFWLLSDPRRVDILFFCYALVLLTGFIPRGTRTTA